MAGLHAAGGSTARILGAVGSSHRSGRSVYDPRHRNHRVLRPRNHTRWKVWPFLSPQDGLRIDQEVLRTFIRLVYEESRLRRHACVLCLVSNSIGTLIIDSEVFLTMGGIEGGSYATVRVWCTMFMVEVVAEADVIVYLSCLWNGLSNRALVDP